MNDIQEDIIWGQSEIVNDIEILQEMLLCDAQEKYASQQAQAIA